MSLTRILLIHLGALAILVDFDLFGQNGCEQQPGVSAVVSEVPT